MPAVTGTTDITERVTTHPAVTTRRRRCQDAALRRRRRTVVTVAVVVAILAVELVIGWPSLAQAVKELRSPHPGWLAGALVVEIASMGVYARMQRRLLRSAGTKVPLRRVVGMAYAAHSLSVTLPGGPAFSTSFNFRQMRRFGASAAVASWCIALSGILSAGALVAIGVVGAILTRGSANWSTLLAYIAVAALLAGAVRAVARRPQWLVQPAGALLARVNRLRRRPEEHGRDRVVSFVAQLRTVRLRPADFTVAAWFAVANWLLDAACLWMACIAVGADTITATQLLIAYCAGMAAASIPIVPGGLGLVDSALIIGLVAGGLTTSDSIAAVLLYRMISLGFIIGMGWIFWVLLRRRQSEPEPVFR
ncbi:membrane protein [Virgisporangium aliadipatigenens]|uniref:Membrane protein n=1 Tax=Virgisporangium aliadipatigenens TaxID=741659 RepID=A0A8J3YKL6_9ACTN|nr:YbhN family protein [Virgisporangium aliadipatigenens]GIJ45621.1 membrane protein [Virgisporangium aliadipatigenens]